MKQIKRMGQRLALGLGLLIGAATSAQATTIISSPNPGSEFVLLNNYYGGRYADRLTDWLGKGSLTLTSIYDSYDRTDAGVVLADDVEASVAGKGPTLTIFEANPYATTDVFVIGWYNPLNGVTDVGGNADETAINSFIFNLSTDRVLRPTRDSLLVSNVGVGRDLQLNPINSLFGSARTNIYRDANPQGILWNPTGYYANTSSGNGEFVVGRLEVYSISVDALAVTAPVPEPASWAMMFIGFGVVGGVTRYQRRKKQTAQA